jgi:biotin carboxylase
MPLPQRYLVESLVAGPEVSVETFGREVVGITRKHLGDPPAFIEVGHDFPASLEEETAEEIRRIALRALEVIGLGWGPAHLEMRLAPEGPTIIEVNPRLAGGMIPELVRLAFGVDLVREMIRLAGRGEPDLGTDFHRRAASIRFLLPKQEGIFEGVDRLEEARQMAGVTAVEVYIPPGRRCERHGDFRDRVGHVIATGSNGAESGARAEQARDRVQLRVEP